MSERVLMALLLAGLTACSNNPAAPLCSPGVVRGDVAGLSIPVFDGENLSGFRVDGATVDGDLAGSASAEFDIVRFDEQGTIHFTGSHEFMDSTNGFLFQTSDEGITTATGEVENHMTVVTGGTGELTTTGTVDLQTGELRLEYQGEICL